MYGPSSSMVDYTAERRKTERERKVFCMFLHHRALQHREREREREKFCVRKLNFKIFEVCHNE